MARPPWHDTVRWHQIEYLDAREHARDEGGADLGLTAVASVTETLVSDVHDDCAHALEQLVDAKITGGELAVPAEPSQHWT